MATVQRSVNTCLSIREIREQGPNRKTSSKYTMVSSEGWLIGDFKRCVWFESVAPSHQSLTPQFPRSKKRRWSPTEVGSCRHGYLQRSPLRSSWGSCSGLSYSGCTSGWNARTSAPSAPSPLAPWAAPAPRRRRRHTGDRWRWTAPAAGTARYPR